jgi:hypothetical protein
VDGDGERKRPAGEDRREGDVAARFQAYGPDDDGGQQGGRGETEHDAGAGSHAFASLKAQPESEGVAEYGAQAGEDWGRLGSERVASEPGVGVRPPRSAEHGQQAFEDIETENGQAQTAAEDAHGVGGANITTAMVAQVKSAGLASQPAKWGGSGQISQQDRQQNGKPERHENKRVGKNEDEWKENE